MNYTNNASARMSYDIAKDILFKSWIASFLAADKVNGAQKCRQWVENRKLSQGEIRCEVQLIAGSTNFTFALTTTQNNTNGVLFNTENRLNQQDSLVTSEYAIMVGKPASQIDTTWKLRTYGNTQDFTAAAANALDTTFYSHGNFSMKVNNDVIIPYRGLLAHHYRPQTQQTAALGAGSPNDQLRGAEDATITDEPNILLIGSKNYQPEIILPVALGTVDEFTRVVLIFKGILAQNSTVIN